MRLLILSSKLGYQFREFAETAKKIGAEVLIGSDRCSHLEDPWRDGAVPVKWKSNLGHSCDSCRSTRLPESRTYGSRPPIDWNDSKAIAKGNGVSASTINCVCASALRTAMRLMWKSRITIKRRKS